MATKLHIKVTHSFVISIDDNQDYDEKTNTIVQNMSCNFTTFPGDNAEIEKVSIASYELVDVT